MTQKPIETPRGIIVITPNGRAELKWNSNFKQKWMKRYSDAQKYVDSEVLRLSEPYTPFRTGMLIKSGTLGTEIGSGEVKWIAPYAKAQYYMQRKSGTPTVIGKDKKGNTIIRNIGTPFNPLRGPYWFERMKASFGQMIIAGAKAIAGKGK